MKINDGGLGWSKFFLHTPLAVFAHLLVQNWYNDQMIKMKLTSWPLVKSVPYYLTIIVPYADLCHIAQSSQKQHPSDIQSLFQEPLDHIWALAIAFAFQHSYEQMNCTVFYRVNEISLSASPSNWVMALFLHPQKLLLKFHRMASMVSQIALLSPWQQMTQIDFRQNWRFILCWCIGKPSDILCCRRGWILFWMTLWAYQHNI